MIENDEQALAVVSALVALMHNGEIGVHGAGEIVAYLRRRLAAPASHDAQRALIVNWRVRGATELAESHMDSEAETDWHMARSQTYAECANELGALLATPKPEAAGALAGEGDAVKALRDLRRGYVSLLESGRDRILDLGGECDPVDVMERSDPHLRRADLAIAALSAAPVAAQQPAVVGDAWKNAILNELVGTSMDARQDEPPESILNRIIRWHQDVATDPALTPAATPVPVGGEVPEGLCDAAPGARYGHHPDPATDFCIEVESLIARAFNAKHGLSKPGEQPEPMWQVVAGIELAMRFRVGGDQIAKAAKATLRALERETAALTPPAADADGGAE